ncbi:uncharacterized protein MYCFIDRAFT_180555 [Pseudocercospora fijiensis CIRAD86]|uniref:Uncharacterized protein n=1 Tax=Pseudocercospora fijiensis (strain CIRAD86) TaxID=383855 RepID=M2ZXQ9_PSEFD|nr:uncharacterized protein MYCFIDRAFT_180555 [Pseudocercospora fijiensis CIRAD86]EME76896.1 hypothetical protein MYCFIDRAFT_180555 [Pseudocercospora fijiensis CIRAD86]
MVMVLSHPPTARQSSSSGLSWYSSSAGEIRIILLRTTHNKASTCPVALLLRMPFPFHGKASPALLADQVLQRVRKGHSRISGNV